MLGKCTENSMADTLLSLSGMQLGLGGVEMMKANRIDVKPLITHEFAIDDAAEGFEMAADQS